MLFQQLLAQRQRAGPVTVETEEFHASQSRPSPGRAASPAPTDTPPGRRSTRTYFWHNGRYPDSPEYKALQAGGFSGYRLRIGGLVAHPVELSLADLRKLPVHTQIT
ncbi:hypothetical protein GCM10023085_17480 [Actinomadura viridis]